MISRPAFGRIRVLALLVFTAFLCWIGARSFERKIASFQPLGFEAVAAEDHWRVTRVESGRGVELAPGDRIVLVDGETASTQFDLDTHLRNAPQSTLVVLRGDRAETIVYRRLPLDIDAAYLVLAFIGIGYLAIGLYTLWRTPDAIVFYLWALASAVLYIYSPVFPVDGLGKIIFFGDEAARLLLPPLTLHLFLAIPREAFGARIRRLIPFVYLPTAILLAIQTDYAFFGGRWLFGKPTAASLHLVDRLELAYLFLCAFAAVAVLVQRLRRVREWEAHRQLLWLAVGMLVGYAPFCALYGLPQLLSIELPKLATALAVLPLAAVPVAFAYAILRYRLWDLALIVRNGLSYTITLVVGLASFSLFDLAIRRYLSERSGLGRDLATFVGGLAIAALVVPAHRGIAAALERLHYGTAVGRRRGLVRLGQDLLHERDLDRLCASLLAEIETGLDLEKTNLYLAQGEGLVAVHPDGGIPPSLASHHVDGLSDEIWRGDFDLVLPDRFPGDAASVATRLYRAGYRYVFPLHVREKKIGLLFVSLRRGGQPLNSEEVDLARALLDQAALAIENAQLLDQVQKQLELASRLQRHNEGILESSPAGIAVVDADGIVRSSNLAFAALCGRTRASVIGRTLAELLPEAELPAPGEGLRQLDFRMADGTERTLHATTAPMLDGEEQRVVTLQDVTERVAMENALKERDRLASLGMLAAGVAHEVNTPLTGISSYAQLLLDETEESDPRHDLLRKVERQTFRASRIVNGLLDFARKRDVERGPVDLGKILAETADLLHDRMASGRVTLDWNAPAEAVTVTGSEGELQQVFTNLILNAVDAMSPAGGALRIVLGTLGDRAVVAVADTGPGIAPENVDRIFQPFFTTKQGRGGTGLGLSISYNIVEQHGGRLRVESHPGEGACFLVELPRTPTAAPGA